MALNSAPGSSRGIFNAIKQSFGLFGETNKAEGPDNSQNPILINEYESKLPDEKILELISQWKKLFNVYYSDIQKTQEQAFDYWIGKQRKDADTMLTNASMGQFGGQNDLVDNLLFEAIETFLPIATRANPDPLVTSDPSDIGQQIGKDIKNALAYEADTQKLRRKLAKGTRQWILNRLGVWKIVWNPLTRAIKTEVINPTKMGFDPDGHIDEGGIFRGEWLFEKKKVTADRLVEMFPKKKAYIVQKAQGRMGTKLEYYEWWYCGTDVFYTIDQEVLGKFKNPNWNYDGTIPSIDPETDSETEAEIQGSNHMKELLPPYVFLSIFSTGRQPHDETSLILQNIPSQDRVNRRNRQIDKNVESMNNGIAVSGKSFTEDQAAQAASALRRGVAIRVPNGDVREAIQRLPAPPIPDQVFKDRDDARIELRNLFGTSGSTPQGTENQDTVRGKILVNQMDASRIGGGITEFIEQVADTIYNFWVQFMYVYYDEEHFFVAAGTDGGSRLIQLKNDQFPLLKTLTITVKEGSLIPKDPLTQRNEAIDLWSANAIDPLTFYKRLDVPDPVAATNQLMLWQMYQKGQIQPQMYLPSFQVAAQPQPMPQQQPGTGGPAVSPPPTQPQPQGPPQPAPGSQEAVSAESKQLLGAIPAR